MDPRVVDPASVEPTPWRNGGGSTRVLLALPHVRISLATIDGPSAYSVFEGWRRWSCVVDGAGLDLVMDGVPHPVVRGELLAYDGATPVHATPVGGPVLNLNLMLTGRGGMGAGAPVRAAWSGGVLVLDPQERDEESIEMWWDA